MCYGHAKSASARPRSTHCGFTYTCLAWNVSRKSCAVEDPKRVRGGFPYGHLSSSGNGSAGSGAAPNLSVSPAPALAARDRAQWVAAVVRCMYRISHHERRARQEPWGVVAQTDVSASASILCQARSSILHLRSPSIMPASALHKQDGSDDLSACSPLFFVFPVIPFRFVADSVDGPLANQLLTEDVRMCSAPIWASQACFDTRLEA